MTCKEQPVTCRAHIAELLGLKPQKNRPWQYSGQCPLCGHGGFSLSAATQNSVLRHLWHCNCRRCQCDQADVRAAMLKLGVSDECLGRYAADRPRKVRDLDAVALRAAMDAVLADPKIRALADLKLRMAEVIDGVEAPAGWTEFLAFAERAGVPRSKRYEAAYRWGRRQRQ